jgi:hypothetical protein
MKVFVQCLYLLAPLLLISCNDESSPIGSDFFQGSAINMTTIDTLTIRTSTILFDSLVSGDAPRLLVGYHVDEDLGAISSSTYFQLGLGAPFSIDKQTTRFNRAELRLIHDGYSYYDTTSTLSFSVHRLKQQLAIHTDNIYNTSRFTYDPTPMAGISYKPKPNKLDTVYIPLPEAFGADIIRLAQSSAVPVSATYSFLGYFYGLAVIPDAVDGPVVGFSTTAEVRIYYEDNSVTPSVEKFLSLQLGDNLKYNKISGNRLLTSLNGLKPGSHYGSGQTDHKGYIQSGAGVALRVEIPYLRSIMIEHEGLTIVSAQLQLSPSRDNSGQNLPLPSDLVMQRVNYKNDYLSSYSTQGILVEDYYLERDTHYSVDVTAFINQQIALEEENQNALVFTTDDATFRSTVSRLYIDDQFGDRPMKLSITCLVY